MLSQKLSQVDGVGEVVVGGSSLPAVRVELNPDALYKYGIGLEDVRAALASANAHSPKGAIEVGDRHYQIYNNDQATTSDEYKPLIIAYRNGAPVRLTDVGEVVDWVENLRNAGLANGKPSVLVIIYRSPGANIIATVDRVYALLPELQRGDFAGDRSPAGGRPLDHHPLLARGGRAHADALRRRSSCWWCSSSCAAAGRRWCRASPCRSR